MKKNKPQFIIVTLSVFDAQMLVVIGATIEQVKAFANKNFSIKPDETFYEKLAEIGERTMGRNVYDTKTGANVVWLRCVPKKPQHIAVLAHELLHATHFLFDHLGIPITVDNDEVVCYTMQYMLKKVLETCG